MLKKLHKLSKLNKLSKSHKLSESHKPKGLKKLLLKKFNLSLLLAGVTLTGFSGTALANTNVVKHTPQHSKQWVHKKWLNNHTQFKCLVDTVYHETRGEPVRGQVAVANVVLNRIEDERFPDTPCSVMNQKGQFAFVGKGYKIQEKDAYTQSKRIVEGVLKGKYKDYSKDSVFFNSSHRSPAKSAKFVTRIGGHSFYASNVK